MAETQSPPIAAEGQRVRVVGNDVWMMQDVLPRCDTDEGHWYCEVHGEHFPNNLTWWGHIDEAPLNHLAVWICNHHWAEVP